MTRAPDFWGGILRESGGRRRPKTHPLPPPSSEDIGGGSQAKA